MVEEPLTMKLSMFHVLCYLGVLTAFVLSAKSDWKNQPVSNPSSSIQETREKPLDASNPRDKRALGLILSGLAQVFGYTVNPVQIASLPNPATESDETRVGTQSSGTQANSTQSNGSSTTAAPRQRETIRFTGVVNFGNGTDVLTQLQQYEALFHRGNNSTSATTSASSATQSPQVDPRPPLVVKIPLPVVPQPDLQPIPQPPLPEIPPQDIMLSYPAPIVPVRKEQQMRRKNLTEKVTVQNQTIQSGMDVRSHPPSTTVVVQTEDPRWKKEYEDRLTELERKQEEQAKKLREQEWYRNRQKEDNYNYEEDGKEYDDRKKQMGEQHSECRKGEEESDKGKESEEEEDQSREKNEEKIHEYSTSQKTKKPEESEEEEEEEGYQNYKNDDVYKKDMPQLNENYTSIQYNEPLPLSEDDEQRRPEDLRNSYGEPLYNRELFEDGFVNFFGNQPLRDIYNSPFPNSKEKISEEEEDPRENQKHDDRSDEREEENIPARNKYEEYSLEEDMDTKRKDENDFEPSKKYFTNIQTNSKNQFEERGTIEEMEFGKYMPLIVPIRYLTAPEELRKAKEKSSSIEKSKKDNNVLETGITKKISKFKESWRSKKENLKPIIGLPEKPRQLHEGEQKDLQIWPPPFDFVLDSTIHTNVVQAKFNNNDSIEIPNIRQKPDSFNKKKEERQQRNRIFNNSTEKVYDSPEDIYYQRFKNDHKHKIVSEKRLNKPINAERSNRTHFKIEVKELKKFEQNDHGKELPQFHEHYKYISNNNYKNTERPNVDVQHSSKQQIPNSLHFKNFESLKHNIEKNEPVVEDKNRINDKNQKMQDVQQKSDPSIIFDPTENYSFFDFNENVHGFNHGRENDRLSEVFESNKRIENKRAIGLTIPQQDVYHYDESLTKFSNEPESKSVKVRGNNYSNGAIAKMHQEQIGPSESISYISYPSIL